MRDSRLDILRGYAILTIALNHLTVLFYALGMQGRAIPTLTYHGFSSAAEIFFLISGYMVGMVYLSKNDAAQRLISRAGKIYFFNVGAFFSALLVAWVFGPPLSQVTSAAVTLREPLSQTLLFLAMLQHPDLLGVLWLYVLFMVAAAIALRLARWKPFVAALLSLCLYLIAQITDLNLPGGSPKGDYLWNFNPLAWQIIFFGGIYAGRRRWHEQLFGWLEVRTVRPSILIGLLFLTVVLHRADVQFFIPAILLSQEKLGLVRIAHALLVVAALASLMVLFKPLMASWAARIVAMCGRQTLNCYVASVPATYALAGIWQQSGGTYAGYLFSGLAILIALVGVAAWSERKRGRIVSLETKRTWRAE